MALTKVIGLGLGNLDDNITFSTASKGVHIGVTSATAANLLDDFEEGTFDVTIRDAASGGNTGSVTQTNKYVKIGSFVWMQFNLINITTTGMTGGNVLYLTGLPFTPATGSYGSGSVIVNQVNIDNNVYDLNVFQNAGQSYAAFLQNVDNSGSTSAPVSLFDNGTADVFGTYMIQV
tara:strand:+ start:498 stop:1025 length:528 start_codon:yes stop_codon:yes gene_type:complete